MQHKIQVTKEPKKDCKRNNLLQLPSACRLHAPIGLACMESRLTASRSRVDHPAQGMKRISHGFLVIEGSAAAALKEDICGLHMLYHGSHQNW